MENEAQKQTEDAPAASAKPKADAAAVTAPKLTIDAHARVFYQADPTNPLPGVEVAVLKKGEHVLKPGFELSASSPMPATDFAEKLKLYLASALSVLLGLQDTADLPEPVQQICQALYAGAGIADRSALQEPIKALDADTRTILRGKGVRLGPILLFCPEMNKPAPASLRGILWAVYHELSMPAALLPEGVVSKALDADAAPKDFYKAMSYPVYGGRAIRIDMLDRVVNLVYELADKGKFQAQHSMAEWLGCPITDLYAVLEDLGHKKVHDPAEEAEKLVAEDSKVDENAVPADEKPKDASASQEKPELATFALKRGSADGKPFKGKPKQKFDGKKADKPAKKKPKHKGGKKRDSGPRIVTAGPDKKEAVSPFAALEALKKGSSDSQ